MFTVSRPLAGTILVPRHRLPGVGQERERDVGRRRVGVADQDERLEERTGRALGQEPGGRRLRARPPIRGRRRRARAVPKYIARSAMIGAVASTTIENDG